MEIGWVLLLTGQFVQAPATTHGVRSSTASSHSAECEGNGFSQFFQFNWVL